MSVAQQHGTDALLEVERLRVSFRTEDGVVQAVDDVSLTLRPGEILAVVGESGSGKSVTGMTLLGLTRSPNARIEGLAKLRGQDLLQMSDRQLNDVRGEQIAMIFQDPMTALNPVHRVGEQIVEMIRAHRDVSKAEARAKAIELLERVGVPQAAERVRSYPHEFSGGMRQRVMIAMALSCSPAILIADEPTTALDVTIQAQILREIKDLCEQEGTAVVMITHDLGVVADVADKALVMYSGRVVESGTLDDIFYDPQHPYTWGLLGSIARVDAVRPDRLPAIPGLPPSLLHAPQGCHFRTRCPHAFAKCVEVPELEQRGGAPGHLDRCFLSPEEKQVRRVGPSGRIGLIFEGPES
jgi:peptide/nickel transport system ATP-binding protein/oligopeptide transport system ATP-binding protein